MSSESEEDRDESSQKVNELFKQYQQLHRVCYPTSLIDFNKMNLTSRAKLKRWVGRGGFSDVYRGRLDNQKKVALKILRLPKYSEAEEEFYETIFLRFFREFNCWAELDHPYVATLLGFTLADGNIGFVSEWYSNGNVVEYLKKHPNASKPDLILDVAEGLQYLHACSSAAIHGDLKGYNILVNKHGIACIGDFGISKQIQDLDRRTGFTTTSGVAGTFPWKSPELFNDPTVTVQSDIYAFGGVIVEVFCPGKVPYGYKMAEKSANPVEIQAEPLIRDHYPELKDQDWLWNVITACLAYKPVDRPSIAAVVETMYRRFGLACRSAGSTEHRQSINKLLPDAGEERLTNGILPTLSATTTSSHSAQPSEETLFEPRDTLRHNHVFRNWKGSNESELTLEAARSDYPYPKGSGIARITTNTRSIKQQEPSESKGRPAEPSRRASKPEEQAYQIQRVVGNVPRFRILLMGKSGAGKSALINKIFRVSNAEIAHYQVGRTNINQEHTSQSNPYFVLHDSMGFESGSLTQYKIVEDFIQERSSRSELSDRIHAIWLCVGIPLSGARVFETGDEQIFKLNLGNVPIVIVFTKYDGVVTRLEAGGADDQTGIKADAYFQNMCARPLQKITAEGLLRKTPPFRKVSVMDGFEDTLLDLIRLTRDQIPDNMKDARMGFNLAIAHVDPEIKIAATIAVLRREYWKAFVLGLGFGGRSMEKSVAEFHKGIVSTWNFFDPTLFLQNQNFKVCMLKVVNDSVDHIGNTGVKLHIQLVMRYSVGLTIVMRRLFWHMQIRNIHPFPEDLIMDEVNKYASSEDRVRVHQEISYFVKKLGIFQMMNKGIVANEVERLIRAPRFEPSSPS